MVAGMSKIDESGKIGVIFLRTYVISGSKNEIYNIEIVVALMIHYRAPNGLGLAQPSPAQPMGRFFLNGKPWAGLGRSNFDGRPWADF